MGISPPRPGVQGPPGNTVQLPQDPVLRCWCVHSPQQAGLRALCEKDSGPGRKGWGPLSCYKAGGPLWTPPTARGALAPAVCKEGWSHGRGADPDLPPPPAAAGPGDWASPGEEMGAWQTVPSRTSSAAWEEAGGGCQPQSREQALHDAPWGTLHPHARARRLNRPEHPSRGTLRRRQWVWLCCP